MQPPAHQIVHQVVASGHAVENPADKPGLLGDVLDALGGIKIVVVIMLEVMCISSFVILPYIIQYILLAEPEELEEMAEMFLVEDWWDKIPELF